MSASFASRGATVRTATTPVNSADIYDPCSDTITASNGTMSSERAFHTATSLSSGQVLVAGGADAEHLAREVPNPE